MPLSRRLEMIGLELPPAHPFDVPQQQQQQQQPQLAASTTPAITTPSAVGSASTTPFGDDGKTRSVSMPLPPPVPLPAPSIPVQNGGAPATGSLEAPLAPQVRQTRQRQLSEEDASVQQQQQQQQQQQRVASEAAGSDRAPAAPAPIPPQGYERADALGRRRRIFTRKECALHNQRHDCWLIAHGKVYDVTTFMSRHPAGEMAILRKGGSDATFDFDFHSSRAQKMWAPLMIGHAEPLPGQSSDCIVS